MMPVKNCQQGPLWNRVLILEVFVFVQLGTVRVEDDGAPAESKPADSS